MTKSSPQRRSRSLALVAMLAACAGCAGLPQIDPSGRRIFIWPERQQAAATTAPTFGNVDAPPVYAPGSGPGFTDLITGAEPTPQFVAATGPTPVAIQTQKPAEETLSITPSRILAPIGSEVILKAGVCYRKGYLRTNRRIEWMLGQEGTGQFVTVGEQGEMDILRAPWQRPNKHDNSYAVGYTSPFNTCLRRGTDDPSDDVQVRTGEAWITLSSASEGVSYVTAHAPESENWDARRATATVYWVDAQWRLPPPASAQPGQTQTLTTVVTRQSDGAPIAGWTVRYEVLDGGTARVGYEAGDAAEATTDALGKATMQVTPTDDQPGSARLRVTVIRPAQSAPMASPRLELGGGETIVDWSPGAIPSGSGPLTNDGPIPPAPFEPPPRDEGDPIAPPLSLAKPRVEVTLRRDTSGPIRVGDPIPVSVTLVNRGDAPAERILLTDDFDRGLSSPQDVGGTYRLQNPSVPDLGPGDSTVIDLNFSAVAPGRHCHTVTVVADGMQPITQEQCFEVSPEAPPSAPNLRIELTGDVVREVNDTYSFLATVYNDGEAAAENVNIDVVADPQLRAEQATGDTREIENGVNWLPVRIEAGGNYPLEVQFRCLAQGAPRVTLYTRADGVPEINKATQVEIRPGRPAPPPVQPTASPLRGTLSSTTDRPRAGESAVLNLTITNDSDRPIENVEFRLLFPQQISPTLTPAASPLFFRRDQGALVFAAIPSLAVGESFPIAVPYNAVGQGDAEVVLEMRAQDVPRFQSRTVIEVRAR